MRILCLGLLILCAGCSRPPQPAAARKEEKVSAETKILHFYASPGLLAPGETATICYGVENATAVEINPLVDELRPAFNRCFQVSPRQTTTYTLTATGAGTSTASLVINVSGTAAAKGGASAQKSQMILFFLTSTPSVPAGLPATLCYGVTGAAKVSITPPGPVLEPSERHCFTVKPATTTTYTLTAFKKDGASELQRLTVAVR
ncbi:MAG: hypothetical protein LC130_21835 [Bryobacterales bacterium]|nr:hypothetical protein [Bryobacterales bacterium]MEB2362634.1 hypothetical protein [Bryobacterales bacterium]